MSYISTNFFPGASVLVGRLLLRAGQSASFSKYFWESWNRNHQFHAIADIPTSFTLLRLYHSSVFLVFRPSPLSLILNLHETYMITFQSITIWPCCPISKHKLVHVLMSGEMKKNSSSEVTRHIWHLSKQINLWYVTGVYVKSVKSIDLSTAKSE